MEENHEEHNGSNLYELVGYGVGIPGSLDHCLSFLDLSISCPQLGL